MTQGPGWEIIDGIQRPPGFGDTTLDDMNQVRMQLVYAYALKWGHGSSLMLYASRQLDTDYHTRWASRSQVLDQQATAAGIRALWTEAGLEEAYQNAQLGVEPTPQPIVTTIPPPPPYEPEDDGYGDPFEPVILPVVLEQPGQTLEDLLIGGGLPQASAAGQSLPFLLRFVIAVARLTGRRGMELYRGLPDWMRNALVAAGLVVSAIDVDWPFVGDPTSRPFLPDRPSEPVIPGGRDMPNGHPIVPFTGGGSLANSLAGIDLSQIPPSWIANGRPFWHLANGYIVVQRKNGSYKAWKPQKPIVLMPSGAKDLRTFIRADAVLQRQAVKLAKVLRRRSPAGSRGKPKTVVVRESGPGGVLVA